MRCTKLVSIVTGVYLVFIANALAASVPGAQPAKSTAVYAKESQKSTVAPKPQYGGTLKIITGPGLVNLGYPGEQFRPNDSVYARPAVENLVGLDPKGTGKPVPQLALGWKMAAGNKSITFTLRKGVKFHDGTEFNAEAVKFNFETNMKGNRTELKGVSSIDVVDNYTVRLNFATFNPAFLNNLSTGRAGMMVSPAALNKMGRDGAILNPVGTGPFKFVSYQRDVLLKYEKFDGYWQKDKPYLDGVEFLFVANPTTALMSFKTGEAQVIRRLAPNEADELKKLNYSVVATASSISGLAGDSKHPNSPFASLKVRQAVAHAIDANSMVKALFYGFFTPANQWAASGDYNYGYNKTVKGYAYDPKKAKQLLKEAGYPNGFQTKLVYEAGNPFTESLYTAVQAYLAAVGIDVKMDPADSSRFTKIRTTGWDGLIDFGVAYSAGYDLGAALRDKFSSEASTWVSIASPADYNTKLFQTISEQDPKKREAQFRELSSIIVDKYCMAIPIFVRSTLMATNSQVHDLDIRVYSHEWLPENVWLSK